MTVFSNLSANLVVGVGALTLLACGSIYLVAAEVKKDLVILDGTRQNSAQLTAARRDTVRADMNFHAPTRLSVPRLDIEKEILPAHYSKDAASWSVDDTHVFYMNHSATPIIYGHATDKVFAPLKGVAKDEVLVVEDGIRQSAFKYVDDLRVTPDDVSILGKKYKNTLLLMTCEGIYSETRRVLRFEYVGMKVDGE